MERNLFIIRYSMTLRPAETYAKGETFNKLLTMAFDATNLSDVITDFQLCWAKNADEARAKFNTVMLVNIQNAEQQGNILTFDKDSIHISPAIE